MLKRIGIDIAGFGLILLGLLTGWLPGPGGIPLVLAGLAVLSLNYEWAEKLVKDFDKKRVEYTKKYMEADPLTSRMIDIFSAVILLGGACLLYSQDKVIFKGLGVGLILVATFALLSNQRRLNKLVRRFKKNKH